LNTGRKHQTGNGYLLRAPVKRAGNGLPAATVGAEEVDADEGDEDERGEEVDDQQIAHKPGIQMLRFFKYFRRNIHRKYWRSLLKQCTASF
jgi:hypothetical protein